WSAYDPGGLSRTCLICLALPCSFVVSFYQDTAPTEIYTLSLHDALPISAEPDLKRRLAQAIDGLAAGYRMVFLMHDAEGRADLLDRKSTRLNSSHGSISYAVFCLKKKKKSRPCRRIPQTPEIRTTATQSS